MEACIAFAYLPSKRQRSDDDDDEDFRLVAEVPSKVQDKLEDKFKLANVKEFHIQGNVNGQILACGVEVRKSPEHSRFRIRIYERDRNLLEPNDRNNVEKTRNYIELSLDEFLRIKRHGEDIRRCFSYTCRSESIFRYHDFWVTAVRSNHRSLLQFTKRGTRIYMSEDTYHNMMSYEEILKSEHAECQRRNEEDHRFIDELANIVAFRRNKGLANGYVTEPAEWFQGGTVTTWNKFVEQVSRSKERLRMRRMARMSDQSPR